MIKEHAASLLNAQVNKEFYSAYLYMQFANYYVEQGLDGFASWFQIQAQEERDHALLFIRYMQNNDIPVTYEAIAKPNAQLSCSKDPLRASLGHEQHITALINDIYAAVCEDKDFRTMQFLDWFVKEQGEEEKKAADLLKKMELFGADPKGLYLLDQELGSRTYAAPTLTL